VLCCADVEPGAWPCVAPNIVAEERQDARAYGPTSPRLSQHSDFQETGAEVRGARHTPNRDRRRLLLLARCHRGVSSVFQIALTAGSKK